MTDYSINPPRGGIKKVGRGEYALYFVPIFVVALPFSLAVWATYPLRKGRLPPEGPINRAIRDARGITAQIIRA
jgi:PufQ cytochrome subunit